MSKPKFDIHDLTEDSMDRIHVYIEEIQTRLRKNALNPALPTEYKEVLSYELMALIKIEDVLDTIIYEIKPIKLPWYKRLFHK